MLTRRTWAATCEAVKPLADGAKAITASDDVAHPRLVEIDAPDEGLADLRREGELLEHVVSDEALIDAAERVSKSLPYRFQSADHFGKLVERAAAFEFPGCYGPPLRCAGRVRLWCRS